MGLVPFVFMFRKDKTENVSESIVDNGIFDSHTLPLTYFEVSQFTASGKANMEIGFRDLENL